MPTEPASQNDQTTWGDDQFVRVPGLFRRWEFEAVLLPGFDYRIEEHGSDACGTRLFAIYRRKSPEDEV